MKHCVQQPIIAALALLASVTVCADTVAYSDGELTQRINVVSCDFGEGCIKKLVTHGSQSFVYNFTSFEQLEARLASFALETTVYDATWDQPLETDALIKVNGNVVAGEKFRRECVSCKKRRRKDPRGTATSVYSMAKQGDVIEVVFQPVSAPVDSNSFTINIKRYENEQLLSSQSKAWYPGLGGASGETIEN